MATDLTRPASNSEGITAELERLSIIGIQRINNRDWSYSSPEAQELLTHINPEQWQSRFDNQVELLTWQQQNDVWKQLVEELHPHCHFEITSVSSTIREKENLAIVWIQTTVTGIENVHIPGLSELSWRLEDGKW